MARANKGEKKVKKIKDLKAPKKPSSPFMLWTYSTRPKLKVEFPDLKFTETGKKLGEMWSALSEADKEEWKAKASEDKIRYNKEYEQYIKTPDYENFVKRKKEEGKAKTKKDPKAPKKPTTSFMIFSIETRPKIIGENPGIKFGEVGKLLGAKWKEMSVEAKAPYEKKAQQDKERYQQDMENYLKGKAESSPEKKAESDSGSSSGSGSSSESEDEESEED